MNINLFTNVKYEKDGNQSNRIYFATLMIYFDFNLSGMKCEENSALTACLCERYINST